MHGPAGRPPAGGGPGEEAGDGDSDPYRALDEVLAPWEERFPQTDVITETVVGGPGSHLAETASDACLLVIGRRGHGPQFGTGSVPRTVLRRTGVPVAIVPYGQ